MSIEGEQMEHRIRDALGDVADTVSPHANWDRVETDLSRPQPVRRPGRDVANRAALVAAVALVLVGGVWLARPATETMTVSPVSGAPQEPISDPSAEAAGTSAPLYVLPASLDGFVDSGTARTEIPSGDVGTGIVVGRAESNGFSDVSMISLVEQTSFGDSQQQVEIGGRLVDVADYGPDEPNTPIAFEVEGVGWIEIAAARPELRETLLSAVTVVNGAIAFESIDDLVELGSVDRLEAWRTRFLMLRDVESSGEFLSIVTRSTPDPDLRPWFGLGDLEQITVRGQPALLTRSALGETPQLQTLSWNEQPGQAISITAPASIDIVNIAEGIRIVGKDDWLAEIAALPTAPPPSTALGAPLGTITFEDEAGNPVDIEPDGTPTILIGGSSSCQECLASLAAVNLRIVGSAPRARFIAVRLNPADSGWGQPDEWVGEIGALRTDAPQALSEALDTYGLVVLNGDNRIVARISVKADDALPELDVQLVELGALN